MSAHKVVLYYQDGWHFCHLEKAWLSENNVTFEAHNVLAEEAAMAELEKLDVLSTPVTVVDDEVVVGFTKKRLKKLLEIED